MRDVDLTAQLVGAVFIVLGVALGGDVLNWWQTDPVPFVAVGAIVVGGARVIGALARDRPGG